MHFVLNNTYPSTANCHLYKKPKKMIAHFNTYYFYAKLIKLFKVFRVFDFLFYRVVN